MDGGLAAVEGTFSRCVSRKRDPLSVEGARLLGGRFNPRGWPALYLAGTPTLAVAESLQLASVFGVTRFNPRLLVSIEVSLSGVLDLTAEDNLASLGLTIDDLTAAWRSDPEPTLTQRIGQQASDARAEGILFPSRIEAGVNNLCVFRDNLRATSTITVDGYDDVWPPASNKDPA